MISNTTIFYIILVDRTIGNTVISSGFNSKILLSKIIIKVVILKVRCKTSEKNSVIILIIFLFIVEIRQPGFDLSGQSCLFANRYFCRYSRIKNIIIQIAEVTMDAV